MNRSSDGRGADIFLIWRAAATALDGKGPTSAAHAIGAPGGCYQ
jgi:hypothetical protein